jgi:two-component system response regulator AtoC
MTYETYELAASPWPTTPPRARVSLVFSWADELRAVPLGEGQSLVLGRAEPAQIIIDDRSLSRMHARFSLRADRVHVQDLGSKNGTRLNGQLSAEAFVEEGDIVTLGIVEARVAGHAGGTIVQQARVVPHAAWMEHVADEIARAQYFTRPGSVIAARHAPEMPLEPLLGLLRPVDRVCFYAPRLALVLLPELDPGAAAAWAQRVQARANGCFSFGLVEFPNDAASAESLVSLAASLAQSGPLGAVPQRANAIAEARDEAAPLIACEPMRRLYELVSRVAHTSLPVLILGETGAGKELVARAVHERSQRARAPFKPLNCATLPVNLLESALFGHERGAFTGADRQAQGIFEQAQRGTVFLDEVGELTPQAQSALLRVLEQRRIVRLGGSKEVEVDVRVVAATHRDLAAMVAVGTFREDLLFRLDALTLRVPPLRERKAEIPVLAELFLARARQQWGASASTISSEVLEALQGFAWPGNVRQLRNVIERAVAMCPGNQVELEDLPEHFWPRDAAVTPPTAVTTMSTSQTSRPLDARMRELEIEFIRGALDQANGNQSLAARLLGLPRRTLANKVHMYGLQWIRRPGKDA